MKIVSILGAGLLAAAVAPGPGIAGLRWQKRIVLVTAPGSDDPGLAAQRLAFAELGRAAADRDLVLIAIIGDRVTGSGDAAAALRRTWRLPADRFAVVLIGKDGGEKRRATSAFAARDLVETIDAMPMRRSGER